MYFLRLTLYFILTTPQIKGYVLLAANIEDFKSLAKKIIPDNINDELLAIDSDSNDKIIEDSKDGDEKDTISKETKPYMKARKEPKIKLKLNLDEIVQKVKDKIQKELTIITENHQKKKSHLKRINEDNDSIKSHKREKFIRKDSANTNLKPNLDKIQESYLKESKPNDFKDNKPKGNRKKQHKQRIHDSKYVAELFVATSPKHISKEITASSPNVLLKQNKPKRPKTPKLSDTIKPKYPLEQENKKETKFENSEEENNKKGNKYLLKTERNKKRLLNNKNYKNDDEITTSNKNLIINTAVETHMLFDKFDMTNKNDSYEDYATPKKDYSSDEKPTTKHKKFNKPDKNKHIDKKVTIKSVQKYEKYSQEIDLNKDKNKKQKMSIATDTTKHNWNTKKRFDVQKVIEYKNVRQGSVKVDNLAPILVPLSKQDKKSDKEDKKSDAENIKTTTTDYEDDYEVVTEEVKARTENLNFEEGGQRPNLKKDKKNSSKNVFKSGTVIPKRDFYKIPTPNYLGKLPVVGEKYRFDEPIPEEDREPENLEPIGKPPSIINGKVKVD